MKLSSIHLAISAFAAAAGVVFAAVQTFSPLAGPPAPINVTVAMDKPGQTATENMTIAKTGIARGTEVVNLSGKGDGAPQRQVLDLVGEARFSAALNDGSERRYVFRDLFDGRPETYVTIAAPDRELNVLVDFGGQGTTTVSGFVYTPPPGSSLATVLDVMVLPEGDLVASGRPIRSFALQTTSGSQTFALPEKSTGKGLWLRIAGPAGADTIAIGDLAILK